MANSRLKGYVNEIYLRLHELNPFLAAYSPGHDFPDKRVQIAHFSQEELTSIGENAREIVLEVIAELNRFLESIERAFNQLDDEISDELYYKAQEEVFPNFRQRLDRLEAFKQEAQEYLAHLVSLSHYLERLLPVDSNAVEDAGIVISEHLKGRLTVAQVALLHHFLVLNKSIPSPSSQNDVKEGLSKLLGVHGITVAKRISPAAIEKSLSDFRMIDADTRDKHSLEVLMEELSAVIQLMDNELKVRLDSFVPFRPKSKK